MNRTDSPQLEAVDQLLTRFLKSEMPQPWPKPPALPNAIVTPAANALPTGPSPLVGSRLSLAASVALIVGGCWLLSNLTGDRPAPTRDQSGSLEGGTAGTKHLEKVLKGNKSGIGDRGSGVGNRD